MRDGEFEFQRLHGMGEELYEELAKLEDGIGDMRTPVRVYAPVGSHKELLAYFVRRLLENGANSNFVNRIADEQVSIDELVSDPAAELAALNPSATRRSSSRSDVFGDRTVQQRRLRPFRSARSQRPCSSALKILENRSWTRQTNARKGKARANQAPVPPPNRSRHEFSKHRGGCRPHRPAGSCCANRAGTLLGAKGAQSLLDRTADLYEENREEFYSLCIREAGKTLPDAILEVREAVDFLRFYASEYVSAVHASSSASRPDRRAVFPFAFTAAACLLAHLALGPPAGHFTGPVELALAGREWAIAEACQGKRHFSAR